MRLKSVGIAGLIGCTFFVLTGCQPTLQCGSWAFTGTPVTSYYNVTSAFTFDPVKCGKSCQCNQDIMIQMTWVFDGDTKTNLFASSDDEKRANNDGWNIDRSGGEASAYFGILNNGQLESSWNTAGSNGTPNTLLDEPGGWGPDTQFYAVDVAVCHSEACNNKILGYYFWSYILDSNDVGQSYINAPAWKDLDTEFQSAAAGWNKWAPNSGQLNDGTGILAHATVLPTLSEL